MRDEQSDRRDARAGLGLFALDGSPTRTIAKVPQAEQQEQIADLRNVEDNSLLHCLVQG